MAISPAEGLLFWADNGGLNVPAKIGKVRLDGENAAIVFKNDIYKISFITYDPASQMVYWSDVQQNQVISRQTSFWGISRLGFVTNCLEGLGLLWASTKGFFVRVRRTSLGEYEGLLCTSTKDSFVRVRRASLYEYEGLLCTSTKGFFGRVRLSRE